MKQARRSRLFAFVLLALALPGCTAAVDGEITSSSSAALCGAAAPCEPIASEPSKELTSVPEDDELSVYKMQTDTSLGGSTCRRVCACCARNGNRFCCSHCRFCSGPIGATDVLSP